jgi:hypothetical protein
MGAGDVIDDDSIWLLSLGVCDEPIDAVFDPRFGPGFQHLPPVRIVQAGPMLGHPADAVFAVDDRLAVAAAILDQVEALRSPAGAAGTLEG